MDRKEFNLAASTAAFIFGALLVFSDGASINANVVGYSGNSTALAAIVGMVLIIASAALFMTALIRRDVALERMALESAHNEDVHSEIARQELHQKYGQHHQDTYKEEKK